MSDALTARVAETLASAPDRCGWRVGMDDDDYLDLAAALAPLIAEIQAEALRDAAEAVRGSVSYGDGMRPDGTEDPGMAAYVKVTLDAYRIICDQIEARP